MNFSLTMSISLWFIIFFTINLSYAATPATEAVCRYGFEWMNNSKQQSPCLVAAYLEGACGTGYWNIPALPSGNTYDGPNTNQTNLCLCSSVVYSAVSACGACQGEAWITWPVWKLNCGPTMVAIASYKFDIPPGTAVPRWMYQDPTQQSGVTFNNTLAYSVASQGLPDVVSSPQTTGNAPGSPPSSSSGGGDSVNIGAIVGGVISGIGFLTAAVIIGWWYLRRRHSTRSSQAPSKQYIAKWSKEVPVGQAPSRWGGTSHGSDSITGDAMKERDLIMSPTSTLPTHYPYGADQHLPYSNGLPPGRRSQSTERMSPPHQPVAYYSSPAYPTGESRKPTRGHKKEQSGSHSFSRKLRGIPSAADNITPFFLPPVEMTVTNDRERSLSPGTEGRPSLAYSIDQPSPRSRSTRPSRKQKAPVLADPLPSTIEYFQNTPPTLPNNYATNIGSAAPTSPRTSAEGNKSRSSFTGSRARYYNSDDPSAYPALMQSSGRAPSSRRTSADQLSGPVQFSQPPPSVWPDALAEKLALANRDYSPQTPGHRGYAHSEGHNSKTPPRLSAPPSTLPYGTRSMESPSPQSYLPPNQSLVGASLGLTHSVHTSQGLDDGPEYEHRPLERAPSGPVSQQLHQRQGSSELESSAGGNGNGYFGGFARRARPGARSTESNNNQAQLPTALGLQWSIYVRDSQPMDEFDPYRTS